LHPNKPCVTGLGMFQRILILGASRGLGRALALAIPALFREELPQEIHLVSRKQDTLLATADELRNLIDLSPVTVSFERADLTKAETFHDLKSRIAHVDCIVYAAGGGCYGNFSEKEWKDHQWTLQLNLETPMALCHHWLQTKGEGPRFFIVVGSRIAGMNPDPGAAGYAAAKHGLVGWISSLQKELENRHEKVWLFSPGYMDTEMLPPGAAIRREGRKIMPPEAAAAAFWRWILGSRQEDVTPQWHRVLN